jgi:hypothetical protein
MMANIECFSIPNEGTEPPYMHVESTEKRAKFWLNPIDLVWNEGFRSGEFKEVGKILAENQAAFLREWNDYFGI